jgi:hypothetical protein
MERLAVRSGSPLPGSISISVDCGSAQARAAFHEILSRFNHHRVAATWSIADPANCIDISTITRSSPGHELALLAPETDSAESLTRAAFVSQIVRPLQSAVKANIPISTLAMTSDWRAQHLDLLTKYGIKMIRCQSVVGSAERQMRRPSLAIWQPDRPRQICFGLWHSPISATLRGGGWMTQHADLRLATRSINQAIQTGAFCHLRIDADALAKSDRAASLKAVEHILQYLSTLRAAGHATIRTLRETVVFLQPRRAVSPAHSILRAA